MLAFFKRWLGGKPAAVRSVPFSGAQIGRLTATLPSFSQSINADLDGTLVILRSRARNLCANHEYGRRFLSMVATNVVGAYGPTLQVRAYNTPTGKGAGTLDKPANAAIELHWKRWGKRCDIAGRLTLPQLLRVAMKSVARDGEVLIRIVRRRDLPYGLALQLLEADRLDESINRTLAGGNIVRQGVEVDPQQRRVAYYIRTNHPGDRYSQPKNDIERVPAADVFHLFVPERAEQLRGYTWLHAVLMRAQMLQGYEEAALVAARVGASKMGVFTSGADGDGNPLTDVADAEAGGALNMSAEPGEFIDLRGHPGTTLESWNPEYPRGEFGSFVQQCLRGIASGLDVDYSTLANDLTSVNYSSIRAGTIETREMWVMLQEWLIDGFLLALYQQWLASALPIGAITFESGSCLPAERLEKFADAGSFVGRRWPWVDPLKDAQASKELIAAGLASRTEIAASQGRDFADIVDELSAERALLEEAGLPTGDAPPAAAPPADDSMDDEDATAADAERQQRALELQAALVKYLDGQSGATQAMVVALAQIAAREPAPPAVHVNVEGAAISNHLPEPNLTVEAVMPAQAAPQVDVHVPAEGAKEQLIERDAAGEIVRMVTRPLESEHVEK